MLSPRSVNMFSLPRSTFNRRARRPLNIEPIHSNRHKSTKSSFDNARKFPLKLNLYGYKYYQQMPRYYDSV